ncbi:MAG: cytochrome C [Campylobacterota bacterium]|nr:cytochrome C [Campylobacterota bacterium]
MKKIVSTLALGCALLSAGEYTIKDRVADMRAMAAAMNDIQTGFFYNNYDMVATGVTELEKSVKRVKPPLEEVEEKDPIMRYLNQKVVFTNKMVKKINRKSLTILERFKAGDTRQAVQAFTKISKACIECHQEMRSW